MTKDFFKKIESVLNFVSYENNKKKAYARLGDWDLPEKKSLIKLKTLCEKEHVDFSMHLHQEESATYWSFVFYKI